MSTVEPINNFETNNRGSTRARAERSEARSNAVGRYDRNRGRARWPGELGRMPKSKNADMTEAAVQDPYGNGKERLIVTINRRVDVLEFERSHGRISEAGYRTGRQIQEVFERMGGVSGTNWAGTSRVDASQARELRVIKTVDQARIIAEQLERMRSYLGMIDTRLLRRIVGDRMSFAECAALEGKSGERGTTYIATRFRDALEALAEGWTARGRVVAAPEDKHKEAASAAGERQAASIKIGVTATRRVREATASASKRLPPR